MIKYYFNFLINLLRINPIKLLIVILTIISFFSTKFEDEVNKIEVISEIEYLGDYYIIEKKPHASNFKLEVLEKNEDIFIKDGFYYKKKYSDINILLWIAFGIGLLTLLIITYLDEESGWEIHKVIEESIISMVVCEIDNNEYCYTIMDRLIGKNDKRIKTSCILSTFAIRNMKDVYLCPKYQTKSKKREFLLNKIGI